MKHLLIKQELFSNSSRSSTAHPAGKAPSTCPQLRLWGTTTVHPPTGVVEIHMGVSENSGFSPQIIHYNRVFSIINHPFLGTTIFGKHPYQILASSTSWNCESRRSTYWWTSPVLIFFHCYFIWPSWEGSMFFKKKMACVLLNAVALHCTATEISVELDGSPGSRDRWLHATPMDVLVYHGPLSSSKAPPTPTDMKPLNMKSFKKGGFFRSGHQPKVGK